MAWSASPDRNVVGNHSLPGKTDLFQPFTSNWVRVSDGLDDEDFEDVESPVINALSVLTKSGFDPDSVLDAATALKYKRGMRKFLDLQFNGNELDRDFVELLARQVYSRRLGSVVRSNLTQLARDVIDELKADLEKFALIDSEHRTTAEEVEGY